MTANLPLDRSKIRGDKTCEHCGALFSGQPKQRYCSTACRGDSQRNPTGPAARRDRCAAAMVRGWSPAQRERIRRLLTEPWYAGPGEVGLVALIDKISSEEGIK